MLHDLFHFHGGSGDLDSAQHHGSSRKLATNNTLSINAISPHDPWHQAATKRWNTVLRNHAKVRQLHRTLASHAGSKGVRGWTHPSPLPKPRWACLTEKRDSWVDYKVDSHGGFTGDGHTPLRECHDSTARSSRGATLAPSLSEMERERARALGVLNPFPSLSLYYWWMYIFDSITSMESSCVCQEIQDGGGKRSTLAIACRKSGQSGAEWGQRRRRLGLVKLTG